MIAQTMSRKAAIPVLFAGLISNLSLKSKVIDDFYSKLLQSTLNLDIFENDFLKI